MQLYDVPEDIRQQMQPHARAVQCAIALMANRALGVEEDDPMGIDKYEGGVTVRGREICIKADFVVDDVSRPSGPTLEEQAVVDAIDHLVEMWLRDGSVCLAPYLSKCKLLRGDPLRYMLRIH